MPIFSPDILAIIGTLGSALITGIVTYKVASSKCNADNAISREQFVDNHMRTLIDTYQHELAELRADIGSLVKENQLLREEIIQLRTKIMELEVTQNEGQCKSNIRG